MPMSDPAPTVFIVDDVPEVRVALSRMLRAAGYAVRALESASLFLAEQVGNASGCLLLDLCMPGMNGLELQRALLGSSRALPIVFLTGGGDIDTGVRAMKAGAVDFLTKPIDSRRLIAAVEQALLCDTKQRLARSLHGVIQHRADTLTPREREVMTHVIQGRLNKQIAAEIGIVEKTVKVHRARIMSKMGVRSVAELVQLAARIGVAIEPELTDRTSCLSWRRSKDERHSNERRPPTWAGAPAPERAAANRQRNQV
jgi:FixJ family two-component response regulator